MLFFNNCKKMDLSFSLLFLFLFVFIKTRCLREYSFKYYSFNTKNRAAMAVSCNKDRNMVIWGSLFGQLQLTVNKLFNLCVFLFRCYCSGQTFSLLSRFEIFRSYIKTRYFFFYTIMTTVSESVCPVRRGGWPMPAPWFLGRDILIARSDRLVAEIFPLLLLLK